MAAPSAHAGMGQPAPGLHCRPGDDGGIRDARTAGDALRQPSQRGIDATAAHRALAPGDCPCDLAESLGAAYLCGDCPPRAKHARTRWFHQPLVEALCFVRRMARSPHLARPRQQLLVVSSSSDRGCPHFALAKAVRRGSAAGWRYLSFACASALPGIVFLLGRDPGRHGSLRSCAAGMEYARQAPYRYRAWPRLVGFPGACATRSPGRNALAGCDPLRGPDMESLLFIRRPGFAVWIRRLLVVPRTGCCLLAPRAPTAQYLQ